MFYCEKIYQTQRWETREVRVGNVGVGGNNPIRIQSMTTSNTRDISATVAQIRELSDRGCEIARVTVQGKKEAEACEAIKNELVRKGYSIPLVADIHFYPPAAMRVVDFADKVRINPGNFIDKRATFKNIEYDETSYRNELKVLEEKFVPLVEKCKRFKRAMRIGTNHGSLSDRIMSYYGDTASGMVESALEFARVCRALDYHDFLFSMKASNTRVMIQAYRLLVAKMRELGWNYPLHLGVTEAGEGEEGRVKSAVGIGALLLDGLGDTIRVSLTEDPAEEIDPCKRLVAFAKGYAGRGVAPFEESFRKIDVMKKREVDTPFPLHPDGSVFTTITAEELAADNFFEKIGCRVELGQPIKEHATVDAVIVQETEHEKLKKLRRIGIGVIKDPLVISENPLTWQSIEHANPQWVLFSPTQHYLHNTRLFFEWLHKKNLKLHVILQFAYQCAEEDLPIHVAAEYGSLLVDGLGEGICLQANLPLEKRRQLAFSVLQATRMRQSKTEFISCPGCGRTLFDLQSVSSRIRARTSHLPGVKIAIMGCIVNGPGEMADADFGYVGSKAGKVDLYVGKECVERYIDMGEAEDRLIALIKHHGRWVERADGVKS